MSEVGSVFLREDRGSGSLVVPLSGLALIQTVTVAVDIWLLASVGASEADKSSYSQLEEALEQMDDVGSLA